MKFRKMLTLAALLSGALVVLTGANAASATTLCSTRVAVCPSAQKITGILGMSRGASSERLTDTSGETVLDECAGSEVKGPITNSGSSTETVTGTVETLSWSSCTFTTNTLTKGKLEIHAIEETGNGTVTADGTFEVTINTGLFGSCIYGVTSGTGIGTLTEGKTGSATPPVFHTNAIAEKFSGSSFACPSTASLTGTMVMTEPINTTVAVARG